MNTPTHCSNCTVRPAVTGTLLCRECGDQLAGESKKTAVKPPLAKPGEKQCAHAGRVGVATYYCLRPLGHEGAHYPDPVEVQREHDVAEEKALAHRRKHFSVKCAPSHLNRDGENELMLRVTQNGHQWQTIGVLPEEVPKVVTAMQQAVLTQRWPGMIAALGSGQPTPYADATVAFQAALDRYDRACRAMAWVSPNTPDQKATPIRDEWHNAGIELSILYASVLGQIQNAGLLPIVPDAKPAD